MPEPDMPVIENFVIDLDKGPNVESSLVRTLSNGLTIEDLSMGEADGKVASPGRKVKVYYTGMLRENGQVFDSNIGKTPYKFRLGDKHIIDGWNIGVEGMRVGDKRRLTVPPSMGYGSQGGGENIPPNSWLVYEIELVGVRR
nr:peptidyl-prolyl cis-trans isomerase FKBP43 [Ipomoea batatas]